MTIEQQSAYHLSVSVDDNEVVSTEFYPTGNTTIINGVPGGGYPPNKYIVTYFDGTGQLETSNDGETWIVVGPTEATILEPYVTLSKYVRVSGTTGATIHFSLYR